MRELCRRLFPAVTIFTIMMVGCQVDHSPTIEGSAQNKNSMVDGNGPGGPNNKDIVLFRMPQPLNAGGRDVSVRELVTPDKATVFHGTMMYTSISGRAVYVDVKFKIPARAVSDTVTVTMRLDTVLVGVYFEPAGLQFAIPSTIDVTIENLDPFSWGSIAFVYLTPNGTIEPIQFESMHATGNLGKITLKKGLIRHFSQYAFGRLNDKKRSF